MSLLGLGVEAVERGLVPDAIVRAAIRQLCAARLRECNRGSAAANDAAMAALVATMRHGPLAPAPDEANAQHYALPPEFFALVLGPHRKYSGCLWEPGTASLADAEAAALAVTCARADLQDGQTVLELGCGWGSLSLWMAARYPRSRITAVSNSAAQRGAIEAEAAARGLGNLRVVTADMNAFAAEPGAFDRVVSVEMFEHMRNYEALLARIATWLRPDGRLFVHYFCHRVFAYPFDTEGDANWMGRYFFTGGLMPSAHLLRHFERDLTVAADWAWDGTNYQRTAEAWLANLDARRGDVLPILERTYGPADARRWWQRWRLFFLAVSELFGYAGGTEWFVAHTLMQPRPGGPGARRV